MDRKAIQGPAVAVIGGAILVVVGTLMTWITASGGIAVFDRSGVSYSSDTTVMIILAAVAALGAVGELLELEVLPSFIVGSAWLDAAVIGGLAIYDLQQIKDKVEGANFTPGVTASVGEGVYVTIAGAALMLISGLRLVQARKALGVAKPDLLGRERFAQQDEDVRA